MSFVMGKQNGHGGQTGSSKKKSKAASALSGSLSGAFVSACVQPLDVIRTRMQADSAQGLLHVTTPKTIRRIVEGNGIRALWQGTQPTVVRLGVGAGLHFFFLESLKPFFEKKDRHGETTLGPWGAILTGGLSRAMAAVVSCPITVVKTRMEYAHIPGRTSLAVPKYNNTFHALQTIFKTEGMKGLYRGLTPTILSNAPFSAFYYLFYTRLQTRLQEQDLSPMVVNFASSTVAAIGATLLTQPADVVRTRMQLNLVNSQVGTTSLQVLKGIMNSQGMYGLLVGAAPRMLKRTLQTALVWTLYEEISPRMHLAMMTLQSSLSRGVSAGTSEKKA